jgi:CRISPR-associated protein Csx14
MKKILLATLGESPAVVTEAIDRLKSDGVDIGAVTILTTKDIYAQEALNLLAQHIPDYYQGRVEFQGVAGTRLVDAFYDVDR